MLLLFIVACAVGGAGEPAHFFDLHVPELAEIRLELRTGATFKVIVALRVNPAGR